VRCQDDQSVVADREPEQDKTRCDWSPRKKDKWFCACGHEWNTFDTGGVCPACLHQWCETQCLSCSRWSAHSDWYAQDLSDDDPDMPVRSPAWKQSTN
jgi:hypothetical protein